MPSVSVVIPLYNKEPHIARTLNSVLSQTFQDFEIIVVDDGSTDNGAVVVQGYDDTRIQLIRQDNKGVSAARNRGVKEATSDFIAFLDADDEWTPVHLEIIRRLQKKYPEAGMYATAYKEYTLNGNIRCPDYKFIPDPPWEGILKNYFKSAALGEAPVCSSVVCIPKGVFNKIGGFSQEYWYSEDMDLFGKIALKYPVAFSWEIGAIYHWDAINRACNKKLPLNHEEPVVITARNALIKGEVLPEYVEPLNEYIYIKEINRAAINVLAGNAVAARAILKRCNTKWHNKTKIEWLILSMLPYSLLLVLQKLKRKVIGTI